VFISVNIYLLVWGLSLAWCEATLRRENTHTPAATGCLEIHKVRHIPCHLRERKTPEGERDGDRGERGFTTVTDKELASLYNRN
jgi:hypothetical protein